MAHEIVVPSMGESVVSGVVAAWLKQDGESVARDEPVADLETDKVTMPLTAPAAGVLRHVAKVGDTVPVGAVVGRVESSATAAPASPTQAPAAPASAKPAAPPPAGAPAPQGAAPKSDGESVRATPLARKLAAEHGVNLGTLAGSGAGGRIREQDVLEAVRARGAQAAPAGTRSATGGAASPVRAAMPPSGATRERMSPLRQRIASRLVEAQRTAAMLTTFNECDMSAVLALRARFKEEFEKKHGIGIGFMSFFIRAAVQALRAFPLVNAYIVSDADGQPMIERHDSCDIAVAVSTPKGLVVPVIRGCERLTFAQVEAAVKDLATRGRDGTLTLEEMQGGTFTITNGGVFGSLMSTPILNPPQSAILGMHAIKNRPVEDPQHPGQIVLRPMMYLALSYDHRLIDGSDAVRFLVAIKQGIEDPARLLLDV